MEELKLSRYYGIYDKVAKAMTDVFQNANDKTAERMFNLLQKSVEGLIAQKPEDYELHYLFTLNQFGEVNDMNHYKIAEGKEKE